MPSSSRGGRCAARDKGPAVTGPCPPAPRPWPGQAEVMAAPEVSSMTDVPALEAARSGSGPAGAGIFALLTDGRTAEIRPARPQDAGAVREMHAALSPDNLYLRFFSMSPLSAER